MGAKKELGRRESERESEEKKRRSAVEKQEEENRSSKRSDSQLSRNPSDSSSSKNASTASVHSTNLGKPAPNLSFVARPEKPNVVVATEEKGKGSKEEEKKASEGGVGGSSIGWSTEVLRGRASGAERVESTNSEYTNGTEAKESQEVAFHFLFQKNLIFLHFDIPIEKGGRPEGKCDVYANRIQPPTFCAKVQKLNLRVGNLTFS